MAISCLLLSPAISFNSQLLADNYYVSANSGNDTNNGTSKALAWKTISRSLSTIGFGDTVSASDNQVLNCLFERKPDRTSGRFPYHPGKTLIQSIVVDGLNTDLAERNLIQDCKVYNLGQPIVLRDSGTTGNIIRRFDSFLDPDVGGPTNDNLSGGAGNIKLLRGPSSNRFERVGLFGAKTAIWVTDNASGGFSHASEGVRSV